jgi:hypothetical protein
LKRNLTITLANIYYERFPKRIRKIIGPLVEPAYSVIHRICTIASDIYPPVAFVKENGNSDSPNLALLIAGSGDVYPFLLNRIYHTEPEATRQGRRLIWKIPAVDKSQINAILIEADRSFSRFLSQRGFVTIPEWVLFTMDVSMPVEEIFRRWRRYEGDNIRKIRKYQYVHEVVCDQERLHIFYYRMYLPYIMSRFGKLALIASFGYMKNLLQRGELLLVKRESEYVSGLLISTATSTPMLAFIGVKDGRRDYVKQGAISALYYYTILWAKEKEYTELDFGHCRPILSDGLFSYKKKWGMRLQRSPRKHRALYLFIGRHSPYLEQFFINNPLVYDDKGKLKGLLFARRNDQPTRQEVEALKRKYSIPGLEGFTIVSLDSLNSNS